MFELMRAACVTGMGLVSGSGAGVDCAVEAMRQGRSLLLPFDVDQQRCFSQGVGARIPCEPKDDSGEPRIVRYLLDTVEETLGEDFPPELLAGLGIALGTSQGAIAEMAPVHRTKVWNGGPDPEERERWFRYRPGYGAEVLARRMGILGPRRVFGMVCVSSAVAIQQGLNWLREGRVDRVLVGGYDELTPFVQLGFQSIGALASEQLRPFDEGRSGTLLGEAVAMLLLETEEAARARGATIYGRVLGGGLAADAVHMTAPDREGRGLIRAIEAAFRDCEVAVDAIDAICAHGTGTVFNDKMETKALAKVFGPELGGRPVFSIKGLFGHTLGGAGAIDAIATLRGLHEGFLPGTVNHGVPMDGLTWDFVPGEARSQAAQRVLSTNSAFGGNNTALIFSREGLSS